MPDVNSVANQAIPPHLSNRGIKIVNKRNDSLNKDNFLKLLVKQLEHQNPLEPVNDREFIAQMAQFSTLEQMQQVHKSIDSLRSFQANTLIGKEISGRDFVTGNRIQGKVNEVFFDASNEVFLRVNGKTLRFKDVKSIKNPVEQPHSTINPVVLQEQLEKIYSTHKNNTKIQMDKNVSRETLK